MCKIDKTASCLQGDEDLLEELISILAAHLEIFKNSDALNSSPYFALTHLTEALTKLKEFDLTPDTWNELFWSGLFFLDTCKEAFNIDITVELEEKRKTFFREMTEAARLTRSDAANKRKEKVINEYAKLKAKTPKISKDKAAEIISNMSEINLSFGRVRKLLHNA